MSDLKEKDYLASLELSHVSGGFVADDLAQALDLGFCDNKFGIALINYIEKGVVTKAGALAFIGKLVAIEENSTSRLVEKHGSL